MYINSFWPLFPNFVLKHQWEYTASQCMAMHYHVCVEFDHPLWITSDMQDAGYWPNVLLLWLHQPLLLSVLTRLLMSSNTKVKLHQWWTIQFWSSMHWCLYYVTLTFRTVGSGIFQLRHTALLVKEVFQGQGSSLVMHHAGWLLEYTQFSVSIKRPEMGQKIRLEKQYTSLFPGEQPRWKKKKTHTHTTLWLYSLILVKLDHISWSFLMDRQLYLLTELTTNCWWSGAPILEKTLPSWISLWSLNLTKWPIVWMNQTGALFISYFCPCPSNILCPPLSLRLTCLTVPGVTAML